ncbi:PIG-L family deacetylase [Mameliella alba]|nr:PIG-L family deacetylase [Antarctobacter heliothermus]MBY6145287.1 PIG-L family deacetylase [Mameliella alba]MCA0955035.1 PIG-L family deacetylase [Mameliella alba]
MPLPAIDGVFTGPLRIDIALRFDALGGGNAQPFVALGDAAGGARLIFGQLGAGDDLLFELVQGGQSYRLVAEDALVPGETASFTAEIDANGVMTLSKEDQPLAQMQAEVPVALPLTDLTGAATPYDAAVLDLTIEPLSPAPQGGDMAIVAHTDDDLLFMNPSIAETIAAGDPMTTVYLTAGDAGRDASYWEAREAGAKAAYAQMAGSDPANWIDETVTLNIDGSAWEVQSSYLADAPQVRLYFLRTPDGIDGAGTEPYGFGSLEQLAEGEVAQVTTVDGALTYTAQDLTQVLAAVMDRHAPDEVMLQDDSSAIEHSDHVHTTEFAETALDLYGQDVHVTHFAGYDSWGSEENLTAAETALVTSVFETYAAFDPLVTDDSGALREPYTDWVLREYVTEQYSIVGGVRVDGPPPDTGGPLDPGPVDPEPVDPPEDPPEDPAPPPATAADAFGSGGLYDQLLGGLTGAWQPAAPSPTPTPTPTPTPEPTPTPTPVPSGDPFAGGGFYEQFMLSNQTKWDSTEPLDEAEEDDVSDSALI